MAEKMDLSSMIVEETEEQKKPIKLAFGAPVKDDRLSIRVTSETKIALETLGKIYNCSMSEVLRQLAEQGMELVKNSNK